MPRYFTLEQASRLLPPAAKAIREAVQAKSRYQEAEFALQSLVQRIMIMGGIALDVVTAESWRNQRDNSEVALKTAVDKLEDMGCIVKDLDHGLIDFPTLFRGEEVYLCYRMDEAGIMFWHGVHEGFEGRRAIDAEFLGNHRGDELS